MDSKPVSLIKKLAVGLGLILASQSVFRPAQAVITDTDVQTVTAVGNGVTTNYTIGFQFQDNDEIRVYLQTESTTPYTRSLVTYGAGAGKYTITGGDPGTTVVMGTAPTSSQRVIIKRVTSLTQSVDYVETDAFPAENHEEQMDRMVQSLQELDSAVGYKIGLSTVSTYATPTMPDPVADKWPIWNHAGTDFALAPTGTMTVGDVPIYTSTGWSTYNATNGVIAGLAAHIADTANPHAVTATQVGKDTAQWNASKIQGKTVDDSSIGNGRVLAYDSGSGTIKYAASALPTLGSADTVLNVNSAGTDTEYDLIKNANVDPAAAIADTKLGTISTAGKVSNSATTATASNTMSAIMARDSSGQVAASTFTGDLVGNVTGAVTGNASTATALAADPADCGASSLAQGITASGAASCRAVDDAAIASSAAITRSKTASGTAYVVLANNSAGVMSENAAITGSRAVASDANGQLVASATTATELGYVNGVTSSIQTQINALSAGASTVQSYEISNVGVTATVATNALTIGITQADGSACNTGAAACKIGFRDTTATSGKFYQRAITAAPSSLVISSGSTLGTVANTAQYVYVYAIDRGLSGVSIAAMGASTILDEGSLQNVIVEGGAGAADTAGQLYAAAAATAIPVRLVARLKTSQSTAGVWSLSPIEISLVPFGDESVSSNQRNERIERARINCDSASSITAQSGSWLSSVGNISSNTCTLTIATGIFSAFPQCQATVMAKDAVVSFTPAISSATSITTRCITEAGAGCGDHDYDIICMGPR